ncbi:serine/threonine kinase-1 [Cryptosporidium ryanae]|uniref:serine/threonine kinase-1 n=1 Tax=Cryptosporidium ryanae TaxID=515981 RepID=UPI00351A5D71|nr:serine/threonine kinase-1 [Cryptosporidium ryanae]
MNQRNNIKYISNKNKVNFGGPNSSFVAMQDDNENSYRQRKRRNYYDSNGYLDERDEILLKQKANEYRQRFNMNETDHDIQIQYVTSSEKSIDDININNNKNLLNNNALAGINNGTVNYKTYSNYNKIHKDKMTVSNIDLKSLINQNHSGYSRKYYRNNNINRDEYNDYYDFSHDSYASSIYYNTTSNRTKHFENYYYNNRSIENLKKVRNNDNDSFLNKNNYTSSEDIDHFSWYMGQYLTQRYRIMGIIGEGTFGRVFECEDLKRKRKVAIKVVKNVQRYTEAAKIEARILRDVNMNDEYGKYSFCVLLYNAFLFNNSNMCLVFEKLGQSLYEFLRGNCSRGFFLADIQNIAEQILLALSFLRKLRLAHTDLKLENILLTNNNYIWVNAPRHPGSLIRRPVRPEVRLIDFGSATYEDDYHGSIINTRQYRAPEVILDIGWDISSDMWGFGCILMELYTGMLLFRTHEHLEHLAMIEKIIEPFPNHMLKKAYNSKSGRKYVNKHYLNRNNEINCEFNNNFRNMNNCKDDSSSFSVYSLNWPEGCSSNTSLERVSLCKPLESIVDKKHILLAKFARYVLNVDPISRPTPEMALRHEFFRYKFTEEI